MAHDAHDHFVKHWLAHPDAAHDLRVLLPVDLAQDVRDVPETDDLGPGFRLGLRLLRAAEAP